MLYLIIGHADGYEDVFYGVCHSIARVEEICYEAEKNDEAGRYYTWFPVIDIED